MSGHKPELCSRRGTARLITVTWQIGSEMAPRLEHTVTRGCLGFDFGSVMIEKQPVMGSDLKTPNANKWQR